MQLRRLMIVLAICIVGLVIAALGMYRSCQNFTSGGLFGILSSHGHYMMVDGTSTTVTLANVEPLICLERLSPDIPAE